MSTRTQYFKLRGGILNERHKKFFYCINYFDTGRGWIRLAARMMLIDGADCLHCQPIVCPT